MRPRIFPRIVIVLALALQLPRGAQAEPLTEATVIRLAREHDADAAAAREASSVAAAEELSAGLYPNPELAWQREALQGGASEDTVSLTLPIDLSPARSARRALSRANAHAARSNAALTQSGAVERALFLFYQILAEERRLVIFQQTLARLDQAARVLGRRHEEGTASGYESHRLALEAELAESDLNEVSSHVRTLRDELALRLGLVPEQVKLSAELALVPSPTSPPARGPERVASPKSVEHLRAAASEARVAHDKAGWSWVPTLAITGGFRVGRAVETRYGYVAGLALELPILSRGQDLRAEAKASLGLSEARVRASERNRRIDHARAVAGLDQKQRELSRFEAATKTRVERLLRASESGYREGQRSLVELVDAERARTTVALRTVDLALAARRAEIALRAARGEFE